MKVCTKCNIKKDDSEFGTDKRYSKLRSFCKECDNNYYKEYYLKNRKLKNSRVDTVLKKGWRVCLKCFVEKGQSNFYSHGGNTCKDCHNNLTKSRYRNNTKEYKERNKKYRAKVSKDVFKKRGIEARKKYNHSHYSNEKNKEYRKMLTSSFVIANLRRKGYANDEINKDLMDKERIKLLSLRLRNRLKLLNEKHINA